MHRPELKYCYNVGFIVEIEVKGNFFFMIRNRLSGTSMFTVEYSI